MSGMPYQYVVLRCVPRVEREEFVNVGVVLHCQQADFLEAAFDLDEERLRVLAPDLDLDQLTDALRTVCDISQGLGGSGRPDLDSPGRRFGWLAAPRSTIVQPGPRHSGLTTDPAATLVELVDRLVRLDKYR